MHFVALCPCSLSRALLRVFFMLLLAQGACLSRSLTYPVCPTPVLLSRVDRIGGVVSDPASMVLVGAVRARVSIAAVASDSSSYSRSNDSGALTADVLRQFPRGTDVERGEVHLSEVEIGSYQAFHLSFAAAGFDGVPRGKIVRLR